MSDKEKPVPNEGTGPLPPPVNELTVLGQDGLTYATKGTRIIVLPKGQAAKLVRATLAQQADNNEIPL